MRYANRWLLPEGVHEILPEQAAILEQTRRCLFDTYRSWGYELVIPPFIEYLDSLLSGTGADLDLQTFKLTDQLTGRLMGVRADITPQVARIDAHQLKREVPTRLCYLGTVLHARPGGFSGSRAPLQIGAELYGYAGIAGDVEILSLMLETLRLTGIQEFHVDLGHVAIYRSLVAQAGLDQEQQAQLFVAMQSKAIPDLHDLLKQWQVPADIHHMLTRLVHLNGDLSVLAEARQALAQAGAEVQAALDDLEAMTTQLPDASLHLDLAELRGYSYHTGVVFTAYVAGQGRAIARGGRYDHVGEAFGRARPATGFSADLITLVSIHSSCPPPRQVIFAPAGGGAGDPVALAAQISQLRHEGRTVLAGLPGQQGDAQALACTHELRWLQGQWQVAVL